VKVFSDSTAVVTSLPRDEVIRSREASASFLWLSSWVKIAVRYCFDHCPWPGSWSIQKTSSRSP